MVYNLPVSAQRLTRVVVSLLGATVACNLILLARSVIFSSPYYFFLNWNLFLAWVPFLTAIVANHMAFGRKPKIFGFWGIVFVWGIFFPNALYLVTDLLHLGGRDEIRFLFDAITVFSYACTGMIIGLASLELMQGIVKKYHGSYAGWVFALASLTLGSFGVYVGRFLRWNSWEVFTQPVYLAREMLGAIVNPLLYTRASLAFTVVLTIFYVSLYLVYHSLTSRTTS